MFLYLRSWEYLIPKSALVLLRRHSNMTLYNSISNSLGRKYRLWNGLNLLLLILKSLNNTMKISDLFIFKPIVLLHSSIFLLKILYCLSQLNTLGTLLSMGLKVNIFCKSLLAILTQNFFLIIRLTIVELMKSEFHFTSQSNFMAKVACDITFTLTYL